MIKTWVYLLLMLKYGAGSLWDDGDMDFYKAYLDFLDKNKTGLNNETINYHELNELTGGIANLLGTLDVEQSRRPNICLQGSTSLVPFDRTYCFDEGEISNVTEALYNIYMEGEEQHQGGMKLLNMTSLALSSAQTALFKQIDYFLMWHCIRSMVPVIDDNYKTIVENLLGSPHAEYSFFQILKHIFTIPHTLSTSFVVANSDLVLMIWPSSQNIGGVALYEDLGRERRRWIRTIYSNESANEIDMKNLKVAGYIPSEFRERQFSDKQDHVIVMVIIMNGEKYNKVLELRKELKNYIGIGMPRQCKKNDKPLLKAFFRSKRNDSGNEWVEFGREYFDSLEEYDWYTCTLSKMSYFGEFPSGYVQSEGAKISRSCLIYATTHIMDSFFVSPSYSRLRTELIVQTVLNEFFMQKLSKPYLNESQEEVSALIWGQRKVFEDLGKLIRLTDLKLSMDREDICFLNSIYSHFHKSNQTHFETVKEEYCMERIEADGQKWRQTPVYSEVYPENICLDRNLYLPSKYCYQNGLLKNAPSLGAHTECLEEHPVTENTERLYQKLIQCRHEKDLCEDSTTMLRNISNYMDLALLLKYFSDIGVKDMDVYFNLFEYALSLIKAQAEHVLQLNYISSFMFFFFNLRETRSYILEIKKDFIFLTLTPLTTNITGWALFKEGDGSFLNYVAMPLSLDNSTRGYSNDKDLEIVFYLNCERSMNCVDTNTLVDTFIIYSNNFTVNEDYTCRSRIIAFLNKGTSDDDFSITVYLRTVGESNTLTSSYEEGFWSTIKVRYGELAVISITEPSNNVCYSIRKLSIFHMHLARLNDSQEEMDIKRNETVMDLLSQLVVSVNIETRELHDDHSPILHVITFTISTLSVIGLVSVAMSVFTIKDWYQKRFCSLQLSTAVACETIFFLLNTEHFTFIVYIIFYYFMLAQFVWMVVIGYVQYMRFVKVFETSELGIVRPLFFGWCIPLMIALAMVFTNLDCMKCRMCSKNGSIFMYYVMIPISVVIVCNLIIYVMVMVNLLRSQFQLTPEAQKARMRAAIMLPFMLGISWICVLAILAPWSWLSMTGSYLFHIIAPSQGFILSIFLVILDKDTMLKWYNRFRGKCTTNTVINPSV